MLSVDILLWSRDVSLLVKHRFRSDGENTKQLARGAAVMPLLIEAPAVYGKKSNTAVKLHICSKPPSVILSEKSPNTVISKERPDKQRLGNQSSQCIPAAVRCKLNTSQHDLSYWRKAAFNQSHPQLFSSSLLQPPKSLKPSYKFSQSLQCFSFWLPEPRPQPRQQHPRLRWENNHSGVHWHRMG